MQSTPASGGALVDDNGIPPLYYPSAPPPEEFPEYAIQPQPQPQSQQQYGNVIVEGNTTDLTYEKEERIETKGVTSKGKEKEEQNKAKIEASAQVEHESEISVNEKTALLSQDGIVDRETKKVLRWNQIPELTNNKVSKVAKDKSTRSGRTGWQRPRGYDPLSGEPALGNIGNVQDQEEKVKREDYERHFPFFTIFAVLAQAVLLGIMIWRSGGFESLKVNPLYGPSIQTMLEFQAKYGPDMVDEYEFWRFLVPIALHAGIIHFVWNLVFQLECSLVERQIGWWRYGCLYILCGVSGNMFSSIFVPTLLGVGPAGALFGAIPAQLLLLLLRREMKGLVLFLILVITGISSMALGLLPFVDNFAFLGGLVVGIPACLIFVPLLRREYKLYELALVLFVRFCCFCVLLVMWEVSVWILYDDAFNVQGWCKVCEKLDCENFGMGWCNTIYS